MAFRLLRYDVRIWEYWLGARPEARRLPAIVPVVLYHGGRPWTAGECFSDLLVGDAAEQAALGEHVVGFRYVLADLARTPEDLIRAYAGSSFFRLALLSLKYGQEPLAARLEAAGPDELERLTDRVLTATSLGEVFAGEDTGG